MSEIPVSSLTDDELSALQSSGIDLTKGAVAAPTRAAAPLAKVGDIELPTRSPVEAPVPSADLIARARERLAAANTLAGEGSSFEAKSKDGTVLEKQGEVKTTPPKPVEDVVAEADKASFLIAMLGGGAFRKDYPLFGGKLVVTFKTRSSTEDASCSRQAFKDDEFEPLINIEIEVRRSLRMNRYYDYQFVHSLAALTAVGNPPRVFDVNATKPVDKDHGVGASALRASRIDLDKELSHPIRVALRNAHSKFENLVAKMTMEVDNPDFWNADSGT